MTITEINVTPKWKWSIEGPVRISSHPNINAIIISAEDKDLVAINRDELISKLPHLVGCDPVEDSLERAWAAAERGTPNKGDRLITRRLGTQDAVEYGVTTATYDRWASSGETRILKRAEPEFPDEDLGRPAYIHPRFPDNIWVTDGDGDYISADPEGPSDYRNDLSLLRAGYRPARMEVDE